MKYLIATILSLVIQAASFAAATYTVTDAHTDTSDATTHTHASLSLGAAADNRVIIATVGWRGSGTTSLNAATIGGIPAVIVSNIGVASEANKVAIISALVPSGTTGDIVLTWNDTCNRSRVVVRRVIGCSYLPFDVSKSTADDPTYDIDVPAGGIAVGVGCALGTTTTTWVGLTEDDDSQPESIITVSSGTEVFASTQTNLTVTCNFATSSADTGAFASWGPEVSTGGGTHFPPNLNGNFQ